MTHLKTFRLLFLVFTLLTFIGLFCYHETFHSHFMLDDKALISENEVFKTPLSFANFLDILIDIGYGQKSRIVGFTTFLINYKWHGLNVFGYHLFNFFIHVGNAFCLFWFFNLLFATPQLRKTRLFPHREAICLLASAVFAAHPVQTQAVAYITQRLTSLATLFYLLSLCFYLKGRLYQKSAPYRLHYFLCGLCGILGMLTKEIVITLPLQIAFIELFLIKERPINPRPWPPQRQILLRNIGIILIILFSLSIIPSLFDFNIHSLLSFHMPSESHDGDILTLYTYVLTETRAIAHLFLLFFVPVDQNIDYDFPMSVRFWSPGTLANLFFLAGLFLVAFFARKTHRILSFGIFWFFLTLSVEFIPRQNVIFEHKLYLPSVGLSLAAVSVLFELIKKSAYRLFFFSALIAFLSALTFERNKVWKDEVSLWQDTIKKSPNKSRPYRNLGALYLQEGEYAKAIPLLSNAASLNPYNAELLYDLGFAFSAAGQKEKALKCFTRSIQLDPKSGNAYLYRGILSKEKRQWDQAIHDLKKASTRLLWNNKKHAFNSLGIVFTEQGNYKAAFEAYGTALEIDPEYWQARINRGDLYLQLNLLDLALSDYSVPIPPDPLFAKTHVNRGNIFFKKGLDADALKAYKLAVTLNPDLKEAYFNRALLYLRQNDFSSSLSDLNRALELDPSYWDAYLQRGYIYFKQNELESALADYNRLLDHDPLYKECFYYRSLVYYKKGEFDKAWDDVTSSLQLGHQINEAYFKKLQSMRANNQAP